MGHVVYVQNADWLISEQNCPGFCGRVLNETVANGSDDFSVFVSTLSECQVIFYTNFFFVNSGDWSFNFRRVLGGQRVVKTLFVNNVQHFLSLMTIVF